MSRIAQCLLPFVLAASAFAQRPPDMALNPEANRQVVEGVIEAVNKYYVSADAAKRLEADLRHRLESGEYETITSAFDLIDVLDRQMQKVSKDKHLALAYSHVPEPLAAGRDFGPETPQEKAQALDDSRASNFGFEKVERLPGNVGYLELNSFVRPEFSGEMTGAAMTLLANTDALIIDLRKSSGGSMDMVVFLASYFFGAEPVHLGDSYIRAENRVQQWWTFPHVPGERYVDKDVYILLSRRSFSAVEGFASILQHHGRARVVGEPTSGGTHPGKFVRIHPNFAIFVPMSWFVYPTGTPDFPIDRPVYPETRTDYEGTGVEPDIVTPADQALKRAHFEALSRMAEKDPPRREGLEQIIIGLRQEMDAAKATQ